MGRHSSPEQWPYYRSVAGWFLPWVMIAAVVGAAVWVAVASVGGDEGASPALSRTKSPTPKVAPVEPVSTPTPEKTKHPKPAPEPSESDEALPKLITNGVTVQVLNASGVRGPEDVMADKLTELGFEIVAVVQASKTYEQTTVFWSSEDSRPAAEALAQHFGWIVEQRPANLSPDVSVHVVVGQDRA